MHFTGMAVSILAQSLPHLAVGHLDGWKKREDRSRLQRHRLRDAGMLFEERVGVHDKQDDVLEKKHAGSTRLEQDSASSEAPSDDREASVECDPLSKVNDSGIFNCGMDSHCVESVESKLGGFCVASKQAPSISRALQDVCDATTCDCSQFDSTSGVGTFTCEDPGEYSNVTTTTTYSADGTYIYKICTDYDAGSSRYENYCQQISSTPDSSVRCEITFNDVVCNSCELEDMMCPANPPTDGSPCCFIRDCTNTVANNEGNSCELASAETAMPTTEDASNASPSKTPNASPPPPAPSSGSSHAAKFTIAVTAATAVWVASFCT